MNYRALISVPISAPSDSDARVRADALAASLTDGPVVIGHVEAVFVADGGGGLDVRRPVWIDPQFAKQVP